MAMRIFTLISMLCLCLAVSACDKTGTGDMPGPMENTVHLLVEGEPFLMRPVSADADVSMYVLE